MASPSCASELSPKSPSNPPEQKNSWTKTGIVAAAGKGQVSYRRSEGRAKLGSTERAEIPLSLEDASAAARSDARPPISIPSGLIRRSDECGTRLATRFFVSDRCCNCRGRDCRCHTRFHVRLG